jgi:hypothetical protein
MSFRQHANYAIVQYRDWVRDAERQARHRAVEAAPCAPQEAGMIKNSHRPGKRLLAWTSRILHPQGSA